MVIEYKNNENDKVKRVRIGFSWGALLFGGLWYVINGMILKGFLYIILLSVASMYTAGIGGIVLLAVFGFRFNKEKEDYLIKKGWTLVGESSGDVIRGDDCMELASSDEVLSLDTPVYVEDDMTDSGEEKEERSTRSLLKSSLKR